MTIGSGIALAGACLAEAAVAIWGQSSMSWVAMSVIGFVAGFVAARK